MAAPEKNTCWKKKKEEEKDWKRLIIPKLLKSVYQTGHKQKFSITSLRNITKPLIWTKKLQKLSKKCLVISDLFLITYSRNNRMSKMIFSANYLHLLWLTS